MPFVDSNNLAQILQGFKEKYTGWKEAVGTDYKSDMEFLQLYSGVDTDDGGVISSFELGYARFDVVNQDPESFYDRPFSRNTHSDYPLSGTITNYDEMYTGWYELLDNSNNVIAILVTDDYSSQDTYFYTLDDMRRPVAYTTTSGLYVVNAVYDSSKEESWDSFDFFIEHETIYHTIDKNYLPPVEWDDIENKTHGIVSTAPNEIIIDHDDFHTIGTYCTANFYDDYVTCFRNFKLNYDDGYVEEWFDTLKMKKSDSDEFVVCDDGIPMQEDGDVLLYGNPSMYNSIYPDNGDWYVVYCDYSSSDRNYWYVKMDAEYLYLEGLISLSILDVSEVKKLDKIFLPDSGSFADINVKNGDGDFSIVANNIEPDSDEYVNEATGEYSLAEGHHNTASGNNSHAEGFGCVASGYSSHAEGYQTQAISEDPTDYNYGCNHAEGSGTFATGYASHAEGSSTYATESYSHAEGDYTTAEGEASHSEGNNTTASGYYSHAEGNSTTAEGESSHAEGNSTTAEGYYSHAEGNSTTASNNASHAEGDSTTASGESSHAEGSSTTAEGYYSHAEGYTTYASNNASHAEGESTNASGEASHAEGSNANANGDYSHAEGSDTTADGVSSHAEGYGTNASHRSQHVFGEYNEDDPSSASYDERGTYVEIVGNGENGNESNARTLDWDGNETLAGTLTIGGTSGATLRLDNGALQVSFDGGTTWYNISVIPA